MCQTDAGGHPQLFSFELTLGVFDVAAHALRAGWLHTGDVGRIDQDGYLFIEDRLSDMIVSGGENVYPREVEDLLSDHDGINEAAVIGVDDEQFGQRLKAFVVLREGAELTDEDVKNYVKSNLARYKVPREVEFLDSLPRNATGKVLKRELAERD
jgi:fatty-acyl-CoA synthase